MNRLWQVLSGSLGLVLIFLVVPFISQRAWPLVWFALALIIGWGVAVWRRSRAFTLAFISLAALAVYSSVSPGPAFIPLAAFSLSLVAWDLSEFSIRLRDYDPQPAPEHLVRSHLERVLVVGGAGFLLGSLALLLSFRLSFELTVLIGLAIFLGLAQIVRFLRSLSD